MPVKWTPENDQLLLLKILETHEISIDAKKIAAAWPSNQNPPTARAVTERLIKIRDNAKAHGAAGHFSVSSSQKKSKSASNPSTPRKPRTPTSSTNNTPSSAVKRKRASATAANIKTESDADADGEDDTDEVGGGVNVNEGYAATAAAANGNGNGHLNGSTTNGNPKEEGDGGIDLESPTKKLRVSSRIKTESFANGYDQADEYEDAV